MVKKLLWYKIHSLIFSFFLTAAVFGQDCPTVDFTYTPSTDICEGTSITFTANPIGGSNWTYQWEVDGIIEEGETGKTFITNLSSTSIVKVIVNANTCEPVSKSKNITVLPKRTPTVTIIPSKTAICLGEIITFTAISTDQGAEASYRWSIGGVEKQNGKSNTFNTSELTANNKEVKVVLTSSLKCLTPGEISATSSVSIKPDATISSPANKDQTVCIATTIDPIKFSIAGGGTGATVSGLPAGLKSSYSAGIFTISGSSTQAGDFNYTVTTTGTCAQTSSSGIIKVNPSPTVVVPPDIEICNGETTPLLSFSGAIPGTVFNWTNTNTSINLNASGSGNIPAFSTVNTTNAPITSTITVTPVANGCVGASKSFKITVNPTPEVSTSSNIEICNGGTIPQITFSGAVSGTTFNWTNDDPSINLATSGSGNIPSFTAKNSTTAPISATITVTPVAEGCEGTPKSFEIVVNPTPSVDPVSDVTVCNTGTVSQISFSGNVPGTTYSWTNDNPAIGLNTTGTGNIGSFTANNSTNAPITANITVTPEADDCPGASETFRITVNPTPNIAPVNDIEICNGGSIPAIVFSGGVTGTQYTWTNTNTAIGLAASGSGNIASFKATNTTSSILTATITVTPEAADCEGPSETFDIIVNPTATLDDITDIEVCNGESISQITFSGGVAGTIYNWTNSNPSINLGAGGTGNIPAFTATNTTSSPITATITVTPVADGCQGASKEFQIVVNHSLVPSVTITSDDDDNNICDTADSVTFTASPVNGGVSPLYQWRVDGSPVDANSTDNTYTTSSLTDGQSVSVEMTTKDTCFTTEKVTSNEIIHNVYSALRDVIIDGPSGICPTNSTFTYSVPEDENVLGYHWTVPSGFVIKSGQGTSSIAVSFTNPATGDNIISLERSNPCMNKTDNYTVTIDSYASVDAGPDQYVCVGTDIVILEGSIGGAVTGKGNGKWKWEVSGGSIHSGDQGNLNAPFDIPNGAVGGDQFVVTIKTTTEVAGCSTQEDSMTIFVVAEPTVNAGTAATDIVCQSSSPAPISLTGASIGGGAIKGSWAIISGGGTLSSTESTETPGTITYTPAPDFSGDVILELTTENPGDCSEVSARRTITVKPNPSVDQPVDLVICDGDADNSIILSGSSIPGTVYNWKNSNPAIGLGVSGTGTIDFSATNTTNAPITSTITVTPVADGCEGSAKTFTITVNPTATVTKPEAAIICNGDVVDPIILTGSVVSGTTYKWVNNNPSIGLSAEGSGNIPEFVASNPGTAPVTADITVTPVANNCEGTPETFSITVNPTPLVIKPADVVVCDEKIVSQIIFSGSEVASTTYNWENNTPGIGIADSGTGSIPEFNAINSTSEVITATITVTPVANNCQGTPETFTITINPKAGLTKPADVVVCNNEMVQQFNFTGSSVANTTYKWENDTPSIGLAGTGTGNIAGFNAVNTSNQPVTATITVTPVANNCEGISEIFTITVKPTPTITALSDIIVCNGELVSDILFDGSLVTNTIYEWKNNTPSIGLAGSGTGNILGFNAINTTSEAVTATITVTPVADGCEGTSETFSIQVDPTPVVSPPSSITVCSGEIISSMGFTSSVSGSTYEWTIDKEIGLALSGTGNLPEFTATNITNEPIVATIGITPSANDCKGETKTFSITVNPVATISAGEDLTLCSSSPVVLQGSISGGATSGIWTSNGSGSFSDNSINAVYTPSPADVINGSVTLTFSSNDPEGPCVAASDSMVLTIIEEVKITSQPFSVGVCTANDTQLEIAASGDDLIYTWYKVGTAAPVGSGPIHKIVSATAANGGDYYAIVSGNSICSEVRSNTVTVTVDENIKINQHPISDNICIGASPTLTVEALASGSETGIIYTWMYRPEGSTSESEWVDIFTGDSYEITSAALDDSGQYRVRINGPEGYNCGTGYSEIANIKVYGIPTADAGAEIIEVCSTTSPISIGTGASISEGASGLWTTTGAGDLFNATDVAGATYIPTAEEFGQNIEFTLTAALEVEGLEGCSDTGSSDTKNISIIEQPEITAFSYISTDPAATSAEYCETDLAIQTPVVAVNHQNGTGVYSVEGNAQENSLVIDPVTGKFTPDGTSPGTYVITYTFTATANTSVCTTDSQEFTVIIGEQPSAEFSYEGTPYCNNTANPVPVPIGDGILGDFTSTTGLIFVTGGSPGEIDLQNSTPGTYTITNTVDLETGGCQPVSFDATVTINAQPAAPEVSDLAYCINEENASGFTATPMAGGSINWYESLEATSTMAAAPVISTATAGITSFWISQTSPEGCESARVEVKVTINELPEVTITTEGNPEGEEVTICKGDTIILTGNGASTYTWRAGSAESEVVGEEATFSANPAETTTYYITGKNEYGCEDTYEISIKVDEPTVPGSLTGPESVCEASPNGTLTLSDFTGEIQRWEKSEDSGTTWVTIANVTETLEFSNLVTATSFRAIVKSGVCGELASNSIEVTIDEIPVGGELNFEGNGRVFMTCEGAVPGYAAPLILSNYEGEIVNWEYHDDSTTIWSTLDHQSPTLTSSEVEAIVGDKSTIFRVLIKNGACENGAYSATAIVSVIPTDIEPTPVTVEPNVLCYGSEITLTSETGYGDSFGKFEGGAFDNAGIKNSEWSFTNLEGGTNDFTSGANNGRADHWLRMNPHGSDPPNEKVYTADLEDPSTGTMVNWDTSIYPEGNKGFAIVTGDNDSYMETPVFSLDGLDVAVLTFDQAYNLTEGTKIRVEISTDGGATYQEEPLFEMIGTGTSGNYDNFGDLTPKERQLNKMEIDLGKYFNYNNLRIRFNYDGKVDGDVWAVDEIKVPDGAQGAQLIWYYDDDISDPGNQLDTIGQVNQYVVNYKPQKIGWNDFEVRTAVLLDSNGEACETLTHAKTRKVFVFDQYTTNVAFDAGTCGNYSAQLTASVDAAFQGEDLPASEVTLDGYRGRWNIIGPEGSTYVLKNADGSPEPDPQFNPNAILESDNLGEFTVSWVLEQTEYYPDDYYVVELQGQLIKNETCPPTVIPATVILQHCTTLDFDGVDDYVELGDNYNNPNFNYSIEAWIRPFDRPIEVDASTDASTGTIISGPSFEITMADLAGKVSKNGRWYHIAVAEGKLYIDGVENGSLTMGTGGEKTLIGARWNNSTMEPENYFSGWIEEVRIWNTALSVDEIRFMMNQRVKLDTPTNTTPVDGEVVHVKNPGSFMVDGDGFNEWEEIEGDELENDKVWYKRFWGSLEGYYRLISAEPDPLGHLSFDDSQKPAAGVTPNFADPANPGKLHNMETNQQNTSPTPYVSYLDETNDTSSPWKDKNTWLRPDVWDYPNAISNGSEILWNIAKTRDNIHSGPNDIWLLGLLLETGELEIHNTSPDWTDPGQMLRVTHYLNLQGVIDLNGESQLLQNSGSIIDLASKGSIEIDQQGTASSYNYNYWSSPVSPTGVTGNAPYSIKAVMKDGTTPTPQDLMFNYTYHFADGPAAVPRKISSYWLYIFHGDAGWYSQWHYVGENGSIDLAAGYSMKGTSGEADWADPQNYTFKGMPGNGKITRQIDSGQMYLVGNPFPSALDAREFILDNNKNIPGEGGTIGRNDVDTFNGSLYFWSHFAGQTHYLQEYVGGYAVFSLAGATKASATDDRINATDEEGGAIPENFIPVGQGFYISARTLTVGTETFTYKGSFDFKNSQRSYEREIDESSVFHSQEGLSDEKLQKDNREKIWLEFNSPSGYNRQLLVTADPVTTNNFDLGYDAPLIENNKEDMYWIFQGSKFVIQGVADFNEDQELPLGVKVQKEEVFSISIDTMLNIPDNKQIYLKDSLLNKTHNLRKGPYKATAPKGVFEDRFKIVFRSQENSDEIVDIPDEQDEVAEENEDVEVLTEINLMYLTNSREILIQNPQLIELKSMVVNNIVGQKVHEFFEIPLQEEVRLPISEFSSGVYVVKLRSDEGVLTEKIIIE